MDDRKRERVIARLALVLVLVLVAALILRSERARVTSSVNAFIDSFRAEFTRITARVEPPRAERTPPSARSGMPRPPDYPPPLVLDLSPAAPPPVATRPETAAGDNTTPPSPPASSSAPAAKREAVTPNEPAPPPTPPKEVPTLNEPAPPTPEQRERAAALARMVPPASGGAAPAMQVDALALDRMMERGIAMFNATDKEPDRQDGARVVYITAALGYGPARAVIARSYPRSQAVRAVTPPVDAVRFALDAFAVGGTFSKNPEHVVTSLMVFLLDQGHDEALANAVIDAMRDDARLQVIAPLELMFDALNLARGACPAIGRLVQAPVAFAASECNPGLKAQALTYAKQAGPTGRDAEIRRKAAADFAELAAKYR